MQHLLFANTTNAMSHSNIYYIEVCKKIGGIKATNYIHSNIPYSLLPIYNKVYPIGQMQQILT